MTLLELIKTLLCLLILLVVLKIIPATKIAFTTYKFRKRKHISAKESGGEHGANNN